MKVRSRLILKGITLLEVLLSVTIISVLAGLSVPVLSTEVQKNDFASSRMMLVQMLRRGETLSRAVENDSMWGVYATSDQLVLFQGTSYAARVVAQDEVYKLPSSVGVSATVEVNFSKLTGYPVATKTITLTSETESSATVSINERGTVSF